MNLEKLTADLSIIRVEGALQGDVTRLDYDSRVVKPGSLFFALAGDITDGHKFIEQAVANGAIAAIVQEPYKSPKVPTIQVADTRPVLADLAAKLNRHPSRKLRTVGVTGTNGKTTVTFLLKHICDANFARCGLIGTVRYEVGERILPALHTTPEASDIQSLLEQMVAAGCKSAALEVSSHALVQERVRNIEFDAAIFTNLTQDHLDYHQTMDAYFEAKAGLFEMLTATKRKSPKAIINFDDAYGRKLIRKLEGRVPVISYGMGAQCDFRAGSFQFDHGKTTFQLTGGGRSFLVRLPLIGRFNIYNALAALAGAHAIGIDLRSAVQAISSAPQVPGRLENISGRRNFGVYVDYAHTPDALENVLKTLRDLNPRRLIVVFGCGGDRDAAKRPLMGNAVDSLADIAIVTSDNPRYEDPNTIISGITKAFKRLTPAVISDRRAAIFHAIEIVEERDIVVIAGKGHETYQEIGGQRTAFDDADVAQQAMDAKPSSFNT